MDKMKIIYVVSHVNKSLAFEWISAGIKDKFDISFILLNQSGSDLENFLTNKGISVATFRLHSKKNYPLLFLKIAYKFLKIRPNVVHTHLFDASLLGLLVAKLLRVPKRIYTRHHSTFHHEYHPKAVQYDRFINWFATDIIAISENVKEVLITKEKVASSKVHLIHHGFKLSLFKNIPQHRVNLLRKKYELDESKKVIGVISRYIGWKGYDYLIPAFGSLFASQPDLHFIFANASGPDKKHICHLLEQYLPPESYTEIEFEKDLCALYQLFDVFVHVPINKEVEAFGQIYVEALAAGVPSVFTLSGVASEFIVDKKNALVVPFKNCTAIVNAVQQIIKDDVLKKNLSKGSFYAVDKFNLQNHIQKLNDLYEY